MTKAVESPPIPLASAPLWPLSVAAYRALSESSLPAYLNDSTYHF